MSLAEWEEVRKKQDPLRHQACNRTHVTDSQPYHISTKY